MNKELPRLSGAEFAFIRKNSGLSQKKLAELLGYSSSSTINHWEKNPEMLPFQVKSLMESIDSDLWNTCRAVFAEQEAKRKANYERFMEPRRREEAQRLARNQKRRENYKAKKG